MPLPSSTAPSISSPALSSGQSEQAAYTFVLVHGFWHYGALWDRVAAALRCHGHQVHTPTIAGFDPDANTPDGSRIGPVTHAEQVASIASYLVDHDLTNVVLAGHSYGGSIIAKVAEQQTNRIKRLVFQNAIVVRDGHSVLDEVPPDQRNLVQPDTHPRSDDDDASRAVMPVVPYRMWRDRFINDADDAVAKDAYDRLVPGPAQPASEPLNLKTFYRLIRNGTLRCSYLNATEDIAMPPGKWGWHPRFSSRLGTYRLVQMPGSHELVFSNPEGLAVKLLEAARD